MREQQVHKSKKHAASLSEPFLLIKENRFAHSALEQLAKVKSTTRARLVYLHGPSGVGKSHVTRRFLRDEIRKHESLNYACLTASEFAAEFAEASSDKEIPDFQTRYREKSMMILEDVHSLEGRTETQWQLRWLLDELNANGSRVIITSRKSPGELMNFLPQLVNRFHGGTCVAMTMPGALSRQHLIDHFAQTHQIPLSADVAELLAESLALSARELLATVLQLETAAQFEKKSLDTQFVKRYLHGEIFAPDLTISQIARAVAQHFGVTVRKMRSATRLQGLVLPRQCAMYLARELTNASYSRIAEFFGRNNHSTVVHSCKRLRTLLPDHPAVRQHLVQIRQSLGVNKSPDV